MNILEDKPFRCYHKQLQSMFEVVGIDWLTRTVKVIKSVINEGVMVNTDQIMDTFPFEVVKLYRYADKLDNEKRRIFEGNLVAYGDRLGYTGRIKYNDNQGRWVIENTSGGDSMTLAEIGQQYIHIIDNSGR